jgi:hypothetical protein
VSVTTSGLFSMVGDWLPDDGGSGLRVGLLVATVFPAVFLVCASLYAVGTRCRRLADASLVPTP